MKVSKEILDLVPYSPGKPIEETKREWGLDTVFKLASNENPLGPSPRALEAIRECLLGTHRYPDPSCYELKLAWSKHYGVAPEHLCFGNGSNELIDLLIRIFCEPGESIITSEAAFVAYSVCAQAARAKVLTSPLTKDFRFDVSALIPLMRSPEASKARLLFIANPNNPTGTYINEEELIQLLDAAHENENLLTVLDEAYVEFARAKDYPNGLALMKKYPRLCVLRTMSKVYGMAGLRVGALVASPFVIDLVNRVRNPFNVNSLAQVAAIAALTDSSYLRQVQQINWEGLDYYYKELKRLNLPYCSSQANFVFFDTLQDAGEVFNQLLRHGVIARPVKNYGFPRHLRLSVGLAEENKAAVSALEKILKNG